MSHDAEALRYARELALSLYEKHYSQNGAFNLLPDLFGVLTQIDNMTTGLWRKGDDRTDDLREALIQADLKIRSLPGADQSDVQFIRNVLDRSRAYPDPINAPEHYTSHASGIQPIDIAEHMSAGVKFDTGKARFELLPGDALVAVSEVLTFGAAKYGDRNWEKGMDWSRLYGASERHGWAWFQGENADAETGISHLAHRICCDLFLLSFALRQHGNDDRPNLEKQA